MSTRSRPAIQWSDGGEADVVQASGIHITVRSTRPFPPGAPVTGTLAGHPAYPFTLKVAGSRKVEEGIWEVRGRLVTATSAVIAAFARAAPTNQE